MFTILQQITGKDWLLLGFGSVLTVLIALAGYLREFLQNYAEITSLLGEWHTYHWSRRNYRPIFRYELWIVRRSFKGITIKTIDEMQKALQYKGRLSFESAQVVLTFDGITHGESWTVRLTAPIPNDDTMMRGMFVGKDFDQKIFSSITVACRNKRTKEEAIALVSSACQWSEREQAIRLHEEYSD